MCNLSYLFDLSVSGKQQRGIGLEGRLWVCDLVYYSTKDEQYRGESRLSYLGTGLLTGFPLCLVKLESKK